MFAMGWVALGCTALALWEELERRGLMAETAVCYFVYFLGPLVVLIGTPIATVAALFGRKWVGAIVFGLFLGLVAAAILSGYLAHHGL